MKTLFSFFANMIFGLIAVQPLLAQPIPIGANCPSFSVQNLLTSRLGFPETWTFQKKLTIIDYWGTGCSACVADFPRIEALAKMNANDLQIILVNKESRDSTLRFFAKRPKIKLPDLPMMSEDSVLNSWFPHQFVPHHVWINQESKVLAITMAQNANPKRISEYFAGKILTFSVSKPLPKANEDLPMIVADSHALSNSKFYSYLSPSVSANGWENARISSQGNSVIDRLVMNDATAISLFTTAYGNWSGKYAARNSVILQVKDTLKYIFPGDIYLVDDWIKNNNYCYEIKLPPAQSDQLYPTMQRQLSSYFNVNVRKEKRRIKCLLLTRIGNSSLLNAKGGEFDTNSGSASKGLIVYFKNVPFRQFAWCLENIFRGNTSPMPFVDESGINSKIDIEIPTEAWDNLPDYAALNKSLKKYGLRIVEKYCLNDVLVIRENDLKK